jgi:hypothetical protein
VHGVHVSLRKLNLSCSIIATLPRSNSVQDLGVVFDSKLSFTDHIESIVNSSFKSLGFVLRNGRKFSDVDTLKPLYFTYVRSRLEYASIVWSPMYSIHILSLERVQCRFLKNGVHMLTGSYCYDLNFAANRKF